MFSVNDVKKLNNNHAVILSNNDIVIIEHFFQIFAENHSIFRLLNKVLFDINIFRALKDLSESIIKLMTS